MFLAVFLSPDRGTMRRLLLGDGNFPGEGIAMSGVGERQSQCVVLRARRQMSRKRHKTSSLDRPWQNRLLSNTRRSEYIVVIQTHLGIKLIIVSKFQGRNRYSNFCPAISSVLAIPQQVSAECLSSARRRSPRQLPRQHEHRRRLLESQETACLVAVAPHPQKSPQTHLARAGQIRQAAFVMFYIAITMRTQRSDKHETALPAQRMQSGRPIGH